MQDISRSPNDISSNGLFLLVECISIGVGILIVLNTLNIVEEFMEGKEVILNSIQTSPTGTLLPPALLICNQSKTILRHSIRGSHVSYHSSTELQDISANAKLVKNFDHKVTSSQLDHSRLFIHSENRGTCLVIKPSREISMYESIVLQFKKSSRIEISFIHPGDEIFVISDTWPDYPPSVRLKKNVNDALVLIKKYQYTKRVGKCEKVDNYIYSDCIKQKFVEYVTKIHKNEYDRCNNQIHPWTINLTLRETDNNNIGHKTKSRCNRKSLLRLSSLNMRFFDKTSKYELSGCKEPCQIIRYKLKKRFNTNENSVFFKDKKNFKKLKQHNFLIIRYQSTDTFVRETSMSVSFSRFMSLMGGNLGLLLSLSCVTGIFIFYNYIGASFSPWRRMKRHIGLERPK